MPAGDRPRRTTIEVLRESVTDLPRVSLRDADDLRLTPVTRAPAKGVAEQSGVPASFDQYQVAGEIARGGVGAVFKARDTDLGRDVAIKVLLGSDAADPQALRRFVEEAQIASQLQHPGIVPLHALGTLPDGRPYFTMKLVKGRTLAGLLDDRGDASRSRLRLLGIFEQLCRTLAYAHSRGVIHRDLKPSNVMLGSFGEVLVMDWGLAKVLAAESSVDEDRDRFERTRRSVIQTLPTGHAGSDSVAGSVLGTPAYMSPEQARGELDQVDARSDVFGLGAILCEILTGEPPYLGTSVEAVARVARKGYLEDAHERLDACGEAFDLVALAKRCLSLEPRERPSDAESVAREVRGYLDSLEERARRTSLEAVSAKTRAREDRRARRLSVLLALTLLLALLAAGGGLFRLESARKAGVVEASREAGRALVEASLLAGSARAASTGQLGPWERARRAARRARSSLGPAVASPMAARIEELGERVEEEYLEARAAAERAERNRRLVRRLTEIRADAASGRTHGIELAYRDAFRRFGVDVEGLDVEAAAGAIRGTGIEVEIARALHHWAWGKKGFYGNESRGWRKLLDLAAAVDPDPWRDRLRAASEADDLPELRRLASEKEPADLSPLTLELLARELREKGDRAAGNAVLVRAWETHPDHVWLSALAGPPESVVAFRTAALAVRPSSPWLRRAIGWSRFRSSKYEEAAAWFEDALRLGDDPASGKKVLGYAFIEQGNIDRARELLREVFELRPGPAVANDLAMTLFQSGDAARGLRMLEEAVRVKPTAALWVHLAHRLFEQRRTEEAVGAWHAALRTGGLTNKSRYQVHMHLARWYFDSRDFAGAAYHFGESIRANPSLCEPRLQLARTLAELERPADALDSFTQAIEACSSDERVSSELYHFLGHHIQRIREDGRFGAAFDRFLDAADRLLVSGVELDPQLVDLYVEALDFKWAASEPAIALGRVEEACERLNSRSGVALLTIARARHRAGLVKQAIEALEEAEERGLGSPSGEFLLEEWRTALLPDLPTLASIDAALDRPDVLVAEGAEWGFLRGRREPSPGLEWTRLDDFDDQNWEVGPSGFGYGDGDDRTVLEDMPGSYTTVYLRRVVELNAPPAAGRLSLRVRSDDGFVAYVNGKEVGRFRAGTPGQRLDHTETSSDSHEADHCFDIVEVPPHLLEEGPNLVAFQGLNLDITSSDFSLIPEVLAQAAPSPDADRERFDAFRSVAAGPDGPPRVAYMEGRILERAGRPAEALPRFEEAAASASGNFRPYLRIAECLAALGRESEVAPRLEEGFRSGAHATSALLATWLRATEDAGWPWSRVVAAWPRQAPSHMRVLSPTAEEGGVPWRYTTREPDAGWELPKFEDSSWTEGGTPFVESGTTVSLPPRTAWDTEEIWIRRTFEAEGSRGLNPRLRVALYLRVMYESGDTVDVYLNGHPVAQLEYHPPGCTCSSDGGFGNVAIDDPTLLRPGVNVLAVHSRNTGGKGFFDLGLFEEIEPFR